MTREEAIAILARQPAEVREAAAVFVDTSDIDSFGTTDSFVLLAKEFRGIIPIRCLFLGCSRTEEHEHLCNGV